MQILRLFLTVFLTVNVKGKISKVGSRGEREESGSSEVSAPTVSSTISEVGKIFEYGMVGEINKVTTVGGVEKMGFLLKKLPALKYIPQLAGAFGALGSLLTIVFSFIPQGDSPELTLMKTEFSEMNRKLDIITNTLDESNKLLKEYSQRSAYIQAENKIIDAYTILSSLVSSLMNVTCNSETDCKYKKMKLVDKRRDDLDVRGDVQMVLRGAAHNSVFGTSLLKLISETSGCYINKIKSFKSAVAALALKGSLATVLFDMTASEEFEMATSVKQFQTLMFDLEKKSEDIIMKCYKNIDDHVISDTIDLDQKLAKSSIGEANKHVVQFLSTKYSWMDLYVITADTNAKPFFWANDTFQNELNSKTESENENTINYVLIGSRSRVENKLIKEKRFRLKVAKTKLHYASWLTVKYDEAISNLLGVIQYDKYLHNQLKTITVIPKYNSSIIGYVGENGTVEQVALKNYDQIVKNDLLAFVQCTNAAFCLGKYEPAAVIASIYTNDMDILECSKTCNNHGTCFFLPHTKIMGCKCDADYYGDDCSLSGSQTNMALDIINLIDITFKLPSIFDVSIQLGNVRAAIQADLNDVKSSIQAIDAKLTNLFDTLSENLMTTLDLYGLVTQYSQIIRDLKYYYHFLIKSDDDTVMHDDDTDDITVINYYDTETIYDRQLFLHFQEREELARRIVKSTELRRGIESLSFLFIGRQDVSLISHKPLLFLIMDKHRSTLCSAEYKKILDNAYIQLTTLEFEGYYLWTYALELLHFDATFVGRHYKDAVVRHERFFESNICQVKINNSVNFENCTKGYYIYSGMKEDVKCAANFYLTNHSVSLFASEVVNVSSQMLSYSSAREIIGRPDVYPEYGKDPKAWSSSMCTENEFIQIAFKDQLFIEEIMIYETFNGGSIWKIEGLDNSGQWKVITNISPQNQQNVKVARINTINSKLDWSTSNLRLTINCTKTGEAAQIDAIKIKGTPLKGTCSWYDSFSCTPCGCDAEGSASNTCSSDGQCRCKSGYKGKTCLSRNCIIGHWSAWSSCECGPGKTKTRTRPITQKRTRSGDACEHTSETEDCNIKCECKEDERGDNCEHKDCLVSDWSEWSQCPKQRSAVDCQGDDQIIPERSRKRTVTRERQNNGKPCPTLSQKKKL